MLHQASWLSARPPHQQESLPWSFPLPRHITEMFGVMYHCLESFSGGTDPPALFVSIYSL